MKRVQFFGWTFILILCLVLVDSASAESIEFSVKAENYKVTQDKDGYEVIKMEAFATAAVPGYSMLPHRIFHVAVPPDIQWESLELVISSVDKKKLPGIHNIRTCPPDIAWTGSQWLTSADKLEDLQAGVPVRIIATSQLRKWKFVKVEFAPFQYNAETGELELIKKANIVLSYIRGGEIPSPVALQDNVRDDVAQDLFLNYDQAKEWYISENSREAPSAFSDYVIITTEAVKTNSTKLNSFIAHKVSMGHIVSVITETTWGVVTAQAPNHKAEKIREWLKSNYVSMGIEYVLLIGDPSPYESGEGDVPMKMCWPRLASVSDKDSPTDYFYADLTGNWDKDGDGYYGEWSQDMGTGGVDFTPEVYVGRIPVYSGAYSTLDGILQKTINYETEPGSIAWRKSILLPMSFSGAGYDGAPLAEQMKDDYLSSAGYTYWRQYQQGTAYASDNSIYSSEQELRGGYVVRDRWAANDYGIVCWWGHGSSSSASVGYDTHWDGYLFDYTFCSSLDDAHPAFTYQCSCTNAYPELNNNLAYSVLKQGGVETVSATRVSWFNTGVGYGAFDGSTTNSGIGYEYVKRLVVNASAAGDALYLAKAAMTPESDTRLMNFYDFNLYGDPAASHANVIIVPPSITVTSPNGGEVWAPSSVHNITWTVAGAVGNVDIYYSTSNGNIYTLIASSISGGSYPWTLPSTQSTQCRVRVTKAGDFSFYDASDAVFTILGGTVFLPTVTTTSVSQIGGAVATSGGTVAADGGAAVTARGVCWNTAPNPTISNSHTNDGTGTGSFTSYLTGLLLNTSYYVRAYATNSAGTRYGNNLSFTTVASSGLPFSESFSSASWPAGWTQINEGSGITNIWSVSNTNKAGGIPSEMRCMYTNVNPGTARLVTPPINTTACGFLNLKFKHFLDTWSTGGLTIKVQTSADGITWTDETWSMTTGSSNIGPETINTILTHHLNSATTYIGFVVTGNLYYLDYWYIDDVSIDRSSSKNDFNADGQEDILWRYYGSGGTNVVWYLGDSGGGMTRLEAASMDRPTGDYKSIDMLQGQRSEQTFADPREAGGMMVNEKEAQRVFRDPREAGGSAEKGGRESQRTSRARDIPVMKGADELQAQGLPRAEVAGLTWLGMDSLPAVDDPSWTIVGTGDFNGDGKVDILWRYAGTGGYNLVWYMNGVAWLGMDFLPAVTDLLWKIAGTGDFNGDGKVDILWRYGGSGGYNLVWYMNGVAWLATDFLPAVDDPSWTIAGTGDFNGDTKADILWRYGGSGGYNLVWYMNGVAYLGMDFLPSVLDPLWKIAGTGDFNGDAKADILWRYYGPEGTNVVWLMDGIAWQATEFLPAIADPNWRIENH